MLDKSMTNFQHAEEVKLTAAEQIVWFQLTQDKEQDVC